MEAWFFRGMDVSSMRSMGILPMFFLCLCLCLLLLLLLYLLLLLFLCHSREGGNPVFSLFLGYWLLVIQWSLGICALVIFFRHSDFGIQISLFSLLPTCLFPIA